MFESFVNSERCKTKKMVNSNKKTFESFVNSERCKTFTTKWYMFHGLRALLIQKDVKPGVADGLYNSCLRALLIQKDVKRELVTLYH